MSNPELRAIHATNGATFGAFGGVDVVLQYGPGKGSEYRAVREGAGIIERADLGIGRMWGRDPVRMLNGLITNDLGRASSEAAVYAAALTPKGRMITDLRVVLRSGEAGNEVLFDYPKAAEEALREHLKKYVPPMFARWEMEARACVIGVYGPASGGIVTAALGVGVAPGEDAVTVGMFDGEAVIVLATRIAGLEAGFDLIVPADLAGQLWGRLVESGTELNIQPIGMSTLETLRIEAGRPRFGPDMTDETIPAEAYESTGLLARAVSFTKGCYTGQEVVIRIAHRGHVNRHLRGLLLDHEPIVSSGTPLLKADGSKEVGRVTSTAYSPLMGRQIALAYLRREIAPGDEVLVGSASGERGKVVELPFARWKDPESAV